MNLSNHESNEFFLFTNFYPNSGKKKVLDVQIRMPQKKRSGIYEAKKSVANE